MRSAVLNCFKKGSYYNYAVLVFVNNKPVGIGAYFKNLHETIDFMDKCKIESYMFNFE